MKLRTILSVALTLVFISWAVVDRLGISWGLSPENYETVQGILLGMALGLLGWLGYVIWRGEEKKV